MSEEEWCDYGDMPKSQCDHCLTGRKAATTIPGYAGTTRFGSRSTHPDAQRPR